MHQLNAIVSNFNAMITVLKDSGDAAARTASPLGTRCTSSRSDLAASQLGARCTVTALALAASPPVSRRMVPDVC